MAARETGLDRLAREPGRQETGIEIVARADGIDDRVIAERRVGPERGDPVAPHRDGALGAALDHHHRPGSRQAARRSDEIGFAGDRRQFRVIGKEDVEMRQQVRDAVPSLGRVPVRIERDRHARGPRCGEKPGPGRP